MGKMFSSKFKFNNSNIRFNNNNITGTHNNNNRTNNAQNRTQNKIEVYTEDGTKIELDSSLFEITKIFF